MCFLLFSSLHFANQLYFCGGPLCALMLQNQKKTQPELFFRDGKLLKLLFVRLCHGTEEDPVAACGVWCTMLCHCISASFRHI